MSARAWKRRRAKRYARALDRLVASTAGTGSYQLHCEQSHLFVQHLSEKLSLRGSDVLSTPLADFQVMWAFERGRS